MPHSPTNEVGTKQLKQKLVNYTNDLISFSVLLFFKRMVVVKYWITGLLTVQIAPMQLKNIHQAINPNHIDYRQSMIEKNMMKKMKIIMKMTQIRLLLPNHFDNHAVMSMKK